MKFILAYTICSALTSLCNTPVLHPTTFNSWSDCNKQGALVTIQVINDFQETFNKEKLYISYFCNEDNSDKTPA